MTTVMDVPLELIDTAPQVRKVFKDASIAELAADIEAHGVLQPLVVQQNGERFTLLIGERRLRAIRYLGAVTAPAILATVAPELAEEVQLMENIQREDLSTKDLAAAIKGLWEKHKSVSEVAKRVHKSSSWVSKRLALAMNVGPVTATLMDSVKDVELLYLFAKLEKLDGVKARMLAADVMAGDAGRGEILAAIAGEEEKDEDGQGDLFGGSDTAKRSVDVSDQDEEEKRRKRNADSAHALKLALEALDEIANLPAGSPAALKMKKTAQAALARIDTV